MARKATARATQEPGEHHQVHRDFGRAHFLGTE